VRRELGLKLRKCKLPLQLCRNLSSVFDPAHDSIKVMTLHVSKGLELPVVALVGGGRMPAEGEDEREEARLFNERATRPTQRLVMGVSGNGKSSARIQANGKTAMSLVEQHDASADIEPASRDQGWYQ
jgi:superfamily I DNA/RNA helicase